MIRLLVGLLVVMSLRPAFAATTLDQYRDIVLAPKASPVVQAAAKDLQYHLQKIAGRAFPLVTTTGTEGLHFFVGPGTMADGTGANGTGGESDKAIAALPLEGWIIRSVPNGLLLAGNDQGPVRTFIHYHAVPLFLEKYCGVRWLWPGESGEVIPQNPGLSIPELNETGAPQLKRRHMMGGYTRYWKPGMKQQFETWLGHTLQGDQVNANFGHAWASVMPKAMYFEQHPEWYALVNGKRTPAQLCVSNPQLRDEFFKRLLSMPHNQKLDIVSVSANDGAGFCECDLCKAKGSIGDSYWDFVNDIAQRVKKAKPGLGVGTFAYTFGRQPPSKIDRLPDNIFLSMTTYGTQLMLPDGLAEYEDFTNRWKTKGVKIMMREYWGMHYWLDLPVLYPDEIAKEIKFGRDAGMMGAYGETGKNWATQGPNYYMLTHLMWNPDADPKAIMDDFYRCFGPAEKPVRAYYEILQNAVREGWNKNHAEIAYAKLAPLWGTIFTPELMKRATAQLDEADKAAVNDPVLQRRIEFIRVGCDYTTIMGELLGLYSRLAKPGSPLAGFKNEDVPVATPEQRPAVLQRAWELGQQRIELYNKNRDNFAINEGLYAFTLDRNIRRWHEAVGKELGKKPEDYAKLDYVPIPPRKA